MTAVTRLLYAIILLACFSDAARPQRDGDEEEEEEKVQVSVHKSGNFQRQGQKRKPGHLHHHEDQRHQHEQSLMSVNLMDDKCKDVPLGETCPESCFAAELADPTKYCQFKCVPASGCGKDGTNENDTIADKKGYCRRCNVEACAECEHTKAGNGADSEECNVCMPGYYLKDGECYGSFDWMFIVLGLVCVGLVLFGICWFISLYRQPIVNEEGVDHAVEHRRRAMVLQDHHAPNPGEPWSLTTNLAKQDVAGPGCVALFRFQAAVIIWAVVLLAVWCCLVLVSNREIFNIGLYEVGTPKDLCYRIQVGRAAQMRYIWVKVTWTAFAYVFSFIGAIAYGIHMANFFKRCDNETHTFSDYVAVLKGVPPMSGSEDVEEILKKSVKDFISKKSVTAADAIIAVSVGWDFHSHAKQVKQFLEADVCGNLDSANTNSLERDAADGQSESVSIFDRITRAAAKTGGELDPEWTVEHVKKVLEEMKTVDVSYVVFKTEDARDEALKIAAAEELKINGVPCSLGIEKFEPEALQWQNLHVSRATQVADIGKGWLIMIVTCILWTTLLYLPYAHYMSSFTYEHGDEPPHFAEYIFIGLVVGAQFGLFIAAGTAAHRCHFHYEEETQEMYIVYYNASLILNLVMDIVLQTVLSYLQMVGVGARVADGRLLEHVWLHAGLQETFESYPIQKSVGKLIYKYSWPCTFFLPFAGEPFGLQLLPLYLGSMIIRRNAKIKGDKAEKAVELNEVEQGRYADCMFNLVLVCCMVFVAPGYLAKILFVFIISHSYIFAYDTWKTLRYARKFYLVSYEPHFLGQKLFAIPVAMLAVAFVFKANQMSGGEHGKLGSGVLQGKALAGVSIAVFVLHLVIHWVILDKVVYPRHDQANTDQNHKSFGEVAAVEPVSHLTTNPIQCLRSKYKFQHQPPLSMFLLGKEHLMKANPKLGAFYDGTTKTPSKDVEDEKEKGAQK